MFFSTHLLHTSYDRLMRFHTDKTPFLAMLVHNSENDAEKDEFKLISDLEAATNNSMETELFPAALPHSMMHI